MATGQNHCDEVPGPPRPAALRASFTGRSQIEQHADRDVQEVRLQIDVCAQDARRLEPELVAQLGCRTAIAEIRPPG